jgi:hypothetical protein
MAHVGSERLFCPVHRPFYRARCAVICEQPIRQINVTPERWADRFLLNFAKDEPPFDESGPHYICG